MAARRILAPILAALALAAVAYAQYEGRPDRWAQYEREMQDPVPDPPDAWVEAEFAVGRLRFHSPFDGFRRRRWGTDANKGDRIFSAMLRRLTRLHVRSVEQIVDIDSDDMFDWPWLFAVGVGDWELSDSEVARLREYFDRGGFLMVDDFHNEREWAVFAEGIQRVLPNSHIVELTTEDQIFHTAYDINELYQVSGFNILVRPAVRTRRHRPPLARRGGRKRPHPGRHRFQYGRRRLLGMGRLSAVSRKTLLPRHAHGRKLRHLRHDPLTIRRGCGPKDLSL